MADVAREAGVALGTVSRVVNGQPVGAEFKARVDAAIQKLGYRYNSSGRVLRTDRTNTVALIIPNTINPYFALLVHHVNMALETLRNCQHSTELRLGIYDPTAIAADFLLHALEFCVNPVIITKNHTPYRLARERALNELGAAVSLTTRIEDLAQCDFVIAPSRIHEPLPLRSTAIVLTSGEPKPSVDGEIYYSYSFRMPNGFASLKPAELSEEYFCSALYTLGEQYALGSIVPLTCNGKTGAQTVKSLSNLLDIQAKKAYNK